MSKTIVPDYIMFVPMRAKSHIRIVDVTDFISLSTIISFIGCRIIGPGISTEPCQARQSLAFRGGEGTTAVQKPLEICNYVSLIRGAFSYGRP